MTYTMSDVAREVQLSITSLWTYVHKDRMVPAPSVKVGRRDKYDDAGLEAVRLAVQGLRESGRIAAAKK